MLETHLGQICLFGFILFIFFALTKHSKIVQMSDLAKLKLNFQFENVFVSLLVEQLDECQTVASKRQKKQQD